ncbi:family 10 glycosylhydrolase [Streptosporangium sp. NBC_01756]|uniref:family 10 glycosylhydrolase n=1 Tax=Streptosporangium sp. NBC_01756 TaxID=2975950 RepID=UPI002DDB5B3B|nr:family 10 glycosylhydrolase [Streptosporangium sp. NBC_01756]WSC86937.1 family 10 glycosylhydrolase [Streptosporangium sp. NBC_01756]
MTTYRAGRKWRPAAIGRIAAAALLLILAGAVVPTPAAGAGIKDLAACSTAPATPKRQLRAMWIASVANIDWPSKAGLGVSAQQAEFRSWLDLAAQKNMNAVVVQIRPTADAFWPSPYEPWSQWLTGTQGTNPGYDPLAFMVSETHARNIEFHAWFNPYRIANHDDPTRLVAGHPARQNPGWRFAYGGKLYYNPGIPAVRDFIEDAIMDAVTRYDLDGVHLDDYFYPYPVSGQTIPDASVYAQYGAGFGNVHDWRRNNVNLLVKELDQLIHTARSWVSFGVSPFGIWRNAATDPLGSRTSGMQSYDAVYADTRLWAKQGWIDYIAPQIYWHIGYSVADYAVLTAWWSSVVKDTDVRLLIGQAAYRAGAAGEDPAWQQPGELTDHLYGNRQHPEIVGDIFFSAKDIRANRIDGISRLVTDHYSRPALIPVRGTAAAPTSPSITSAARVSNGISLSWQRDDSSSPTSYAVYRVDGSPAMDPCFFADARNLLKTTQGTSFTDTTAAATGTYTYYLTALDRAQRESGPSTGRVVTGTGPFSVVVDNGDASFTAGSNWGTSSFSSQLHGTDYRFADPVTASDLAWFRAEIPATGSYRVEVWYPANSGYNSATPFIVATGGGNQVVNVDQRVNGGQWRGLGTFTLSAGTRNVVGVSRWTSTSGYVIADAVRITKL